MCACPEDLTVALDEQATKCKKIVEFSVDKGKMDGQGGALGNSSLVGLSKLCKLICLSPYHLTTPHIARKHCQQTDQTIGRRLTSAELRVKARPGQTQKQALLPFS